MEADVCSFSSSGEEGMDLKGFACRAILLNPAIAAMLAGNRWEGGAGFGHNRRPLCDSV